MALLFDVVEKFGSRFKDLIANSTHGLSNW